MAEKKSYEDNYRHISIKFNKDKESEMIEYLESKGNVSGHIKELINKDMVSTKSPIFRYKM